MMFGKAKGPSPAVSVLVPCYNVERFLPECLDSLQAQKLQDLQIVCINDGSTDATPDILHAYAERDPRIQVIDKPNSGYGASMNQGLAVARGEYVGIVESDDFASPDMFKTYYNYAKKHDLDLVKSNYYEHSEQGDAKQLPFGRRGYRQVFDPAERLNVVQVLPIIWSALYRRRMLEDNGIRFNETPGASYQDTSFVHRAWFASRRAALLPGAYLHYRVDNAASSVASSAKVYEVCTEYAASEAWLRAHPDRLEAFMPTLQRMKLDTYRWNFNRIAPEYRNDFVAKWAEEFRSAYEAGDLRRDVFDDYNWGIAMELVDDPAAFAEKYHDAL